MRKLALQVEGKDGLAAIGIEDSLFTRSRHPWRLWQGWPVSFFLHGWRRHVCRECTGHLVPLEGESPARQKQTSKNQTNSNQTTNQQKKPGKKRLNGSCKSETKLRKGETKGQRITQNRHSVLNAPVSVFKIQAAGIRSVSRRRIAFAVPFALGTGEALRGETGFASVFGPQNEGHKFTRKCNVFLDASMAKPTPKPC